VLYDYVVVDFKRVAVISALPFMKCCMILLL
jgi:hypothetical protein